MPAGIPIHPSLDESAATDCPAIGFDIGGTDLRAAVVSADGRVLHRVQTSSDGDMDTIERDTVQTPECLAERLPDVNAINLTVAGFLNSDRQTIRFAPHLS